MTRLAIGLIATSLVVIALGGANLVFLWVGVALLVVTLLAVLLDSRRAAGANQLEVARVVDEVISVGAPTPVQLHVTSHQAVGNAAIRDHCPPEFESSHHIENEALPAKIQYTVRAKKRGTAHFGDVAVRATGPWGLSWRQSTIPAAQTVQVNADLSAIGRYQALARRGHLAEIGVRTLRRRGEGSEFERIRDAVPDDPMRSINWRATARTGRLMAVELIPERAQPVILAIDHGRLMGVGAGALTKLDHAINASVLLAHVCLASGDRVGLFAFADRVGAQLAATAGPLQMTRYVDAIRALVPVDVETDYDHTLLRLSQSQKRRSLIVIFTDVVDADQSAALARQCIRLRRKHVPLVVAVQDPAVIDMAGAEPTNPTATYSRAISRETLNERHHALAVLRSAGADAIDVDARTLSPALVNRYLEIKRAGRL
jgi:uncharacterized protein (DUF58 family)